MTTDLLESIVHFCGGRARERSTGGHEDGDGMTSEAFTLRDNLMLEGVLSPREAVSLRSPHRIPRDTPLSRLSSAVRQQPRRS